MLFTRCPDCRTTFRITLASLNKAGGQVRCGRCAAVFDAYTELRRSKRSAMETGTYQLPPQPRPEEESPQDAEDPGDAADQAAAADQADAASQADAAEHADAASQADAADEDSTGNQAYEAEPDPGPGSTVSEPDSGSASEVDYEADYEADYKAESEADSEHDSTRVSESAREPNATGESVAIERAPDDPATTLAAREEAAIRKAQTLREAAAPAQGGTAEPAPTLDAVLDPTDPDTFGDTTLALVLAELDASTIGGPGDDAVREDAHAVRKADDNAARSRVGDPQSARRADDADTIDDDATDKRASGTAPNDTDRSAIAAAVVADADAARADAAEADADADAQVDAILSADVTAPRRRLEFPPPAVESNSRRHTVGWAIGCVLAAMLLGAQAVHHFRAELATHAQAGPIVQRAYSAIGIEIVPDWNLGQYEIFDTAAVAEPNAEGDGSLRISAQVRNNGPRAQPFPFIRVDLKDRWEATVGSRVFGPADYLTGIVRTDRPMTSSATVRAEFDVVDPGAEAYGFELYACLEAQQGGLRCQGDRESDVFH